MMNEIIAHLYLGDYSDARRTMRDKRVALIDVTWPNEIVSIPYAMRIQTTQLLGEQIMAMPEAMERAARAIEQFRDQRQDVLVHCMFGVERAPLTVVWYLMRYHHLSLDVAYALVRTRREMVVDRRHWLPYAVCQAGGLSDR